MDSKHNIHPQPRRGWIAGASPIPSSGGVEPLYSTPIGAAMMIAPCRGSGHPPLRFACPDPRLWNFPLRGKAVICKRVLSPQVVAPKIFFYIFGCRKENPGIVKIRNPLYFGIFTENAFLYSWCNMFLYPSHWSIWNHENMDLSNNEEVGLYRQALEFIDRH